MGWRGAMIVYLKEMKDILRDRRTVISMVLVPILLYPMLSIGIGSLIESQVRKTRASEHPICILPRDGDRELRDAITTDEQLVAVPVDSVQRALLRLAATDSGLVAADVRAVLEGNPADVTDSVKSLVYFAAINAQLIRAAVEIPVDLASRLDSPDSTFIDIFCDETNIKSDAAGDRLFAWARDHRDSLVNARLEERGIDPGILKPYWIARQDVAPPSKKSGFFLGMMLPYMLMIVTIMGGMYPALDITAGEKERNTLETVLAAPVARWHLALGKFLTVLTAALVTMSLATLSMTFSLKMGGATFSGEGVSFSLSPVTVAWILLLMIPMSTLFSSVLIAVAISARSYKEGQSYVTPIMLLSILPAMVSFVPGIEFDWAFALIPIINLVLALKTVLMGVYEPLKIIVVFVETTLLAVFALFVATRMFERESVLFRT